MAGDRPDDADDPSNANAGSGGGTKETTTAEAAAAEDEDRASNHPRRLREDDAGGEYSRTGRLEVREVPGGGAYAAAPVPQETRAKRRVAAVGVGFVTRDISGYRYAAVNYDIRWGPVSGA